MNRKHFSGYGEIIIATVLWSLVGIIVKQMHGMLPQTIIFFRVSLAFIIFFSVLLVTGRMHMIKLAEKRSYLLLFGILQAATMISYFISIQNASVSVAVLLLSTAPVYVTVFSPYLLKERTNKKGMAALFLSIAGIFLIVGPEKLDTSLTSAGILAGIGSGIFYAFQIMTSKYAGSDYSGYTQAFWSFLIAAVLLVPFSRVPFDLISDNFQYLIILAVFPTILSVSFYFNGLTKIKAQSASILGLIEPFSAVFFAVIILNERISASELIGGALILAAAALVTADK